MSEGGGPVCIDCWEQELVTGAQMAEHLKDCKKCRAAFSPAFHHLRTCSPQCRKIFLFALRQLAEDPPKRAD